MSRYLVFILLCFSDILVAQDISTMEIKVVEGFKPSVPQAVKLNHNAVFVDTIQRDRVQKYKVLDFIFPSNYNVTKLTPAIVKSDKLKQLYGTTFSLAGGYRTGPNVDILHNSKRSRKNSYSFRLINSSNQAQIQNNKFAKNKTKFDASIKNIFDKKIINTHFRYSRNTSLSYGHDIHIPENMLQTSFNHTELILSTISRNTDKKSLKYNTIFYISDLNEKSENIVSLNTIFNKDVFGYSFALDVSLENYVNYNSKQEITGLESEGVQLISLAPSLDFSRFNIDFNAGIGIDYESGGGLDFFPMLVANKQLVENVLLLSFGIEDNKYRNTYSSLYEKNPYIHTLGMNRFIIPNDTALTLETTNFKEVFLKFYNLLGEDEVFNTDVRYGLAGNLPYFDNNNNSDYNRFIVFYKDIWQLHINTSYSRKLNSVFGLELNSDYYYWDDKEIAHMPNLLLDGTLIMNLRDKIIFNSVVRYISSQQSFSLKKEVLPYRMYLDLVIDYKYSNKLSAAIIFNNITNSKKEIWRDYQDIGFHGSFQVNWSF